MTVDKSKALDSAGNKLVDSMGQWLDGKEQAAVERHQAHAKSPEAKAQLVARYQRRDTWLVFSEAIPLAMGAIPKDWPHLKRRVPVTEKRIVELVRCDAGVSLKVVNPSEKEIKWRVKPKDFLVWINAKAPSLAPNLGIPKPQNGNGEAPAEGAKPHGNKEVNAQKREKVLAAALGVLAAFPDECRKGGKVSGMAIAKLIESKSPIWFGYEEPPLSTRTMADLISKALKNME